MKYRKRNTEALSNINPIKRPTDKTANPLFCTIVNDEVNTLPDIRPPKSFQVLIKSPNINALLI